MIFKNRKGKQIKVNDDSIFILSSILKRVKDNIRFSEISSAYETRSLNDWSLWPKFEGTLIIEKRSGKKIKIKKMKAKDIKTIIKIISKNCFN